MSSQGSDALRSHLVIGCHLCGRIVTHLQSPKVRKCTVVVRATRGTALTQPARPDTLQRVKQPGNAINGPLVSLANAVLALHASGANKELSKALTADGAWLEAVKGPLADANARRGIVLGGEHPEWDSIAGDDSRPVRAVLCCVCCVCWQWLWRN